MRRRSLLTTFSAGAASVLAGCTGILSREDETPSSESSSTPTSTPKPQPTATWSEDWVSGTKYRVNATVQLNGGEKVLVKQGTTSGETVATITSSGTHTVIGPDTNDGPIEMGRLLFLVRPTKTELDGMDTVETVDSFSVGSQEQPTFPLHLRGLRGSTDPNLETSGTLSRTFKSQSGAGPTALSLEIPEVLYQYYKNRDRTRKYGAYISDTYDDQYLKGIVSEFERYGKENGLSDPGIINHMMAFVQNLQYTTDKVSAGYNEYPKYPVETLVDKEGDCEDTCILLASMLEQFGYGSKLLVFRDKQHMALGIAGAENIPGTYFEKDGQRYYYVETTSPGWEIGQLPPDMEGGTPEFRPINDSGVLVCSYAVNTPASGGAAVEVSMKNVGDGAGTAQATVGFEDKNDELVASAQSQATQLGPQEEHTTTLNLLPPDDQQLRAKVQVVLDGTVQDTLVSDWRTPQA